MTNFDGKLIVSAIDKASDNTDNLTLTQAENLVVDNNSPIYLTSAIRSTHNDLQKFADCADWSALSLPQANKFLRRNEPESKSDGHDYVCVTPFFLFLYSCFFSFSLVILSSDIKSSMASFFREFHGPKRTASSSETRLRNFAPQMKLIFFMYIKSPQASYLSLAQPTARTSFYKIS